LAASVAFPVTALVPAVFAFYDVRDRHSPGAESGKSDVVLDELTDVVVKKELSIKGNVIVPGDGADFRNEISTQDGLLTTLSGSVTIVDIPPANQHLIGFYREELDLDDGVVRTVGIVDLTDTIMGAEQVIEAFGVSGRYRGLIGTRSFKATTMPDTYDATIILRKRETTS
jgi:hypothetical protein